MNRVAVQCIKELRQFVRDRLSVALAFGLPALSMLLYGFATRLEIKNIPLVVQNLDNSALSRSFIERLYTNEQFVPVRCPGGDLVKTVLNRGIAEAVVIIPPEFARKLRAGLPSPVEALIDGTDVNNARVIKNSIIATTNSFLDIEGLSPFRPLIHPQVRLWFNPGRKESLFVVPGAFGIVLLIYPALLCALAMARETEQGTILQIYASSLTASEFILGKVAAYVIVGIAETLLVLLIGFVVFHLSVAGDALLFTLGTLLYLIDACLYGLMIAVGAKTQNAAVQAVAFGGFTPALLLSGYLYPVRNIRYPFNLVADFVPARYYIELSRDTFVRGAGWAGQWFVPVFLTLVGLLLFRIARKRLGRMQISA